MPEDATFCPSCGAPVETRGQYPPEVKENVQRYIFTGLIGALLSVMVNSFSSINLYFVPSFLASIFVIYVYRINGFGESLITSLMVYIFADGVLGTLVLGQYYSLQRSIILMPEIWDVVLYALNPVSSVLAAYVGLRISPKRRKQPLPYPYRREEGPGGVIYSF